MKRIVIDVLIWCALTALLVIGALNLGALESHSAVSLRYRTPVSGQAAWQVRSYAAGLNSADTFWPTFWHETKSDITSDFISAKAGCIYYSGNADLVWPAPYKCGSAPGVTDGAGCAVSSALAWKLWGSFDILGKTIDVDGVTRTVRGVFEEDGLVALLSVRDEDKSHSFTAMELSGGPSSPSREDAVSFAIAAGLGAPDSVLLGTPASLARLLFALPLIIMACYGIVLFVGAMKNHPAALRGALFLALIGFAIVLPFLLDALPGRIIPTRWSDFSFWGSLAGQMGDELREYLSLEPRLKDVIYKTLVIKQVAIAFPAIICSITVCFRWHIFTLQSGQTHGLRPKTPAPPNRGVDFGS